jgi:hypothetical protein
MDASTEEMLGKLKVDLQDIRGNCVVITVPRDIQDKVQMEELAEVAKGLRAAGAIYTVLMLEPMRMDTLTRHQVKDILKAMKMGPRSTRRLRQ